MRNICIIVSFVYFKGKKIRFTSLIEMLKDAKLKLERMPHFLWQIHNCEAILNNNETFPNDIQLCYCFVVSYPINA